VKSSTRSLERKSSVPNQNDPVDEFRRKLRRPLETFGFKLLAFFIPLWPRRAVVGLSRILGKLSWLLLSRERRFGLQNLDAVFGDTKTAEEKRAILTQSYATFCLTLLDVFWFSTHARRRIEKYIETSPDYEKVLQKKANIIISAHFGGWEMMAQAMAMRGVDIASIAATIKNSHINMLFIRLRERTGQVIIPQKGALRTLMTRLKNQGKVGFVLDQNTREEAGGIQTQFMGMPMSVSSAPAALAYRTGTEIIFTFCMPLPGGRYRLYSLGKIQPPPLDKSKDSAQVAAELTQQIEDVISKEIRAYPEFWLWAYKHWRRIPGKTYPDTYPDYKRHKKG